MQSHLSGSFPDRDNACALLINDTQRDAFNQTVFEIYANDAGINNPLFRPQSSKYMAHCHCA
ncbi:hypothetical protein L0337_34200 [candidate division KSB1 bacterium]|nr:hypothetical protein [candidate division KSB1 bacterium]